MQPQGHLQMLLRVRHYGQSPQAAADAPRWRVVGGRGVALEPGFPQATVDGLRARGHALQLSTGDEVDFGFGGAQLIHRIPGGYVAGSDPRKDGCAVGMN
jgi:gamma-glutamyltranspeptidase/glutathione hydrolase